MRQAGLKHVAFAELMARAKTAEQRAVLLPLIGERRPGEFATRFPVRR